MRISNNKNGSVSAQEGGYQVYRSKEGYDRYSFSEHCGVSGSKTWNTCGSFGGLLQCQARTGSVFAELPKGSSELVRCLELRFLAGSPVFCRLSSALDRVTASVTEPAATSVVAPVAEAAPF